MSCKNNSKIFSVFLCVVFSSVASSDNFSISNDGKVGENVALNSNLDKNLSNPVIIGDLTFGANEVLAEGNEIFEAKDGDPLRHLNIRISGLDGVGVRSVKVISPSLIDIEIGKVLVCDDMSNDEFTDGKFIESVFKKKTAELTEKEIKELEKQAEEKNRSKFESACINYRRNHIGFDEYIKLLANIIQNQYC